MSSNVETVMSERYHGDIPSATVPYKYGLLQRETSTNLNTHEHNILSFI